MKTKTFDLASLDTAAACDKGAEIEFLHPATGAPLGIFVTVLGTDSQAYRDFVRRTTNENIVNSAQARKRGKDPEVPTVEKAEQRGLDLLIACTTSWRTGDKPIVCLDGTELPFTPENARTVYKRFSWMQTQADEAIGDLKNFMKV